MTEIGFIKILKKDICNGDCDCGWNITLGGTSRDDFETIQKNIKKHNKLLTKLLIEQTEER